MSEINTTLVKAIHRGQHCQRNWNLNEKMPSDDVETIITAATQCPSKQNLDFYSVIAIQDRETIEAIYETTMTEKGRKNPQVLAHLLLIFVENPAVTQIDRNSEIRGQMTKHTSRTLSAMEEDLHQALGVAAGFVNVTSSMLGYRTGCNKCFDVDTVKEILGLAEGERPILMMGVGIHNQDRNRREEHNEGFMIDAFKKAPIKVRHI